jgi:hypothetical protein
MSSEPSEPPVTTHLPDQPGDQPLPQPLEQPPDPPQPQAAPTTEEVLQAIQGSLRDIASKQQQTDPEAWGAIMQRFAEHNLSALSTLQQQQQYMDSCRESFTVFNESQRLGGVSAATTTAATSVFTPKVNLKPFAGRHDQSWVDFEEQLTLYFTGAGSSDDDFRLRVLRSLLAGKAAAALQACVTRDLTYSKAMDHLRLVYAAKPDSTDHFSRLTTLRQGPMQTVTDLYLQYAQLLQSGNTWSPELVGHAFYNALRPELKFLVRPLLKSDLTLDNVFRIAKQQELLSSSSAFLAAVRPPDALSQSLSSIHTPTHTPGYPVVPRTPAQPVKQLPKGSVSVQQKQCEWCKKRGHVIADCFSLRDFVQKRDALQARKQATNTPTTAQQPTAVNQQASQQQQQNFRK